MKALNEVTDNLQAILVRYDNLPLDDLTTLSEILKELDVNLGWLVFIRDEYYKKFQSVYFNSQSKTEAGKNREAELKVPELDLVRKILKHFGDIQSSIRTQISLRKNN